MPEVGQNLSHYSVAEKIGKGGMGEVYRAKDQKLGREVAIKVLPEEFARDADRVARFQREAKLLASLNHPNIAAIYGLEESGGTHFLVLELIEGDTLTDQIKKGSMPVEEALKLALQISEALDAAHEKGVIHRDLKPANIKVTPDGKVKVLDFGLAKAFAGGQEEKILSNSPTLSVAATQQGVILGTAAYMSPEQAKGKAVDRQTDVWAFGVVLYEMLTGQAAFQGEDVTEILASVVKASVNLDRLPANIHPDIRKLIARCLQKEQKKRFSGIADVQYEIEQVLADPSGVFAQPIQVPKPRQKIRVALPWVLAAIVLSVIIAGIAVWKLKPAEPRGVIRFDFHLPEGQRIENTLLRNLAVSPDGKRFVYCTAEGLHLRSIDEMEARLLPGTGGTPNSPFFSPDGNWIGYHSRSDSKLKKITIEGGAAETLCDANLVFGAHWSEDDTIIYGTNSGGIMRVSALGGSPESIVSNDGRASLASPQFLPDTQSVLYTHDAANPQSKIMLKSLRSGETKELFIGNAAQYLPTGHIVFAFENSLYAVPFDINKSEISGSRFRLVEDVSAGITPQFALSDSGTLVYLQGGIIGLETRLAWVDREGKEEPVEVEDGQYFFQRISPDGKKVALTVGRPGKSDIWIWDAARTNLERLTIDTDSAVAIWTLDGKQIAYNSEGGIYLRAADGTGTVEQLDSLPDSVYPWSWADSGKILILEDARNNGDIGMLSMEDGASWKPLLQEEYGERQPQISPDGSWIAYTSSKSGQYEVYVRPFPDLEGGLWKISTSGGKNPLWSPDGRELFYRSGDEVMAVDLKTEPAFNPGNPKILFRGTYFYSDTVVGTTWDIHPDGKRFLMQKPPGASDERSAGAGRKINVVLNFDEELQKRIPMP